MKSPPVLATKRSEHVRFERIDLDHFAAHFIGRDHLLALLVRDHARGERLLEQDVARPTIEATGADSVADLGLDSQRSHRVIERVL